MRALALVAFLLAGCDIPGYVEFPEFAGSVTTLKKGCDDKEFIYVPVPVFPPA